MDLFSRYLFRQATSTLLLILLSLTGVVWIATALRQLTLITSKGQDSWTFFQITLLALPNLMAIIAPIALLITIIHTLNKTNSDSELIIMTASGAAVWRIGRPFWTLAAIVTAVLFLANMLILPWSTRALEHKIIEVRTDLISQVLLPGEFSSPESGLTFHIRERTFEGELLGLVMHDEREENLSASYLAKRGVVAKRNERAYLIMYEGHIVRREVGEDSPQIIAFDQYAIDLSQMEPASDDISLKPRARYVWELVNVAPDDKRYQKEPGKFRSELHERFASLLYPFVFVAIGLAQLGVAQTNRTGKTKAVLNAFFHSALVRLLGLAATNLATRDAWAVSLMYAVPLIAIAIALFEIRRRMVPRRASALSRRLESWNDAVRERLAGLVRRRKPTAAGDGAAGQPSASTTTVGG